MKSYNKRGDNSYCYFSGRGGRWRGQDSGRGGGRGGAGGRFNSGNRFSGSSNFSGGFKSQNNYTSGGGGFKAQNSYSSMNGYSASTGAQSMGQKPFQNGNAAGFKSQWTPAGSTMGGVTAASLSSVPPPLGQPPASKF